MTAQTDPPHPLAGRPSNRLGTGENTTTRSFRLPDDVWAALEARAARDGVTLTRAIRTILERELHSASGPR